LACVAIKTRTVGLPRGISGTALHRFGAHVTRALGVVMCRGSNMSFHAGQGMRAGELLQSEGLRARKRRTVPRFRELACIDALRQSALWRRNARTVLAQS